MQGKSLAGVQPLRQRLQPQQAQSGEETTKPEENFNLYKSALRSTVSELEKAQAVQPDILRVTDHLHHTLAAFCLPRLQVFSASHAFQVLSYGLGVQRRTEHGA